MLDRLINRLTDNYSKEANSNVQKLAQLTAQDIQENEDTYTQIQNWRDVDQAKGAVLDRLGQNVGQFRGVAPDETYRVLIKSKINRALSDGSINTLIDFLSFLLQIDAKEVTITELWPEGKHAAIHVNVPGGSVNSTGLSLYQFGQLVNSIVAAGIRAEVLVEGTFSFSSNYSESELNSEHGFDAGTLGYSYDPAQNEDLPI